MNRTVSYFLILFCAGLFTACAIADLRPDALVDAPVENAEERGRRLLATTADKMGYDQLAKTQTYSVTANFDWATVWGMMPMNSLPGAKGKDIRFNFATNTFDGQMKFLEGPRKGEVEGLQSWTAYERESADAPAKSVGGKRYPWGLATYHYLTESSERIQKADIVRYAGQTTFAGKTYDRVFLSWGEELDFKEYDQWLVYINRETGFTDLVEVTITDFFLPMPGNMKNATVHFADRTKTSIGAWLPTETVIQLGRPKENIEKDVYTFTYRDFAFDEVPLDALYPLPGLPRYGDSKPAD